MELALNVRYRAGDVAFENAALIFQQSAAGIGIPVELQPMEGRLFSESRQAHDFEVYVRKVSASLFIFNVKPLFDTESAGLIGGNDTNFGTDESDSLIDAVNQATDVALRARLLKRLQAVMHEESNIIFLYFAKERLAVNKRFTNLKISGAHPGFDVTAFTLR